MRQSTVISVLSAVAGVVQGAAVKRRAAIACSDIPAPDVPGAEIISITATEQLDVSGPFVNETIASIGLLEGINICAVDIVLTHPGLNDRIGFSIWLPLEGWNNRFLATGGGGFQSGYPGTVGLGLPVTQGFAAGMTDAGNLTDPSGVPLEDIVVGPGQLDTARLASFSFSSLHELAVIGKAVTNSYYGTKSFHSYFSGCSTGGRQGYTLAQEYPTDFDGILAVAPGLYFTDLLTSLGLAQLVERGLGYDLPDCVATAFSQEAVSRCDGLDGVIDGIVSNFDACELDSFSLVGEQVLCGNESATITAADAEIVDAILTGVRSSTGNLIYPGVILGSNYTSLTSSVISVWDFWNRLFIRRDPDYDLSGYTTIEQLIENIATVRAELSGFIAADSPNLGPLRDNGSKLLTWHGLADEVITARATIRYRETVEAVLGGNERVNEFYRVFLAPGVGHCYGGTGAYPADALDALIGWVEDGEAPETLHGRTANGEERILCPYPLVARFDGEGNPEVADSYSCAEDFAPPVKC
ncbi:hypothetical protein S40288_01769 [Stachybotrys chartarum IBT 40288]|nr:hypothetical protein S40288_01769 [Stachybotrys chartarum IBT 40288]